VPDIVATRLPGVAPFQVWDAGQGDGGAVDADSPTGRESDGRSAAITGAPGVRSGLAAAAADWLRSRLRF